MEVPEEHLKLLKDGQVFAWNDWRRANSEVILNLRGAKFTSMNLAGVNLNNAHLHEADLSKSNLYGAGLRNANLYGANLRKSELVEADLNNTNLIRADLTGAMLDLAEFGGARFAGATLQGASLRNASLANSDLGESQSTPGASLVCADLAGAKLTNANLTGASLQGANLEWANLYWANLTRTNLRGANLRHSNLELATLIATDLTDANLTECRMYGISTWDLRLEGAIQRNLRVTPVDEPEITVDNLEVAQFVHLLLRREKLRNVIETITSKTVLILGRFTPERKAILDALADEVRLHKLIPIIFDFERSSTRDLTETIKVLAGLSLFVIADVTNPKSSPLELQATVPDYQIPFVIIIQDSEKPFAMMDDLKKYDWVLKPILTYRSAEALRRAFKSAVLDRAWEKHKELSNRRAIGMTTKSIEDFLGHSDT